jgi:hypothetical protein
LLELTFNFVVGVGQATGIDPTGTDPSVGISWSDDGGITWSQEFIRKLGRQATPQRITMLRTGMSGVQGRRWRLKVLILSTWRSWARRKTRNFGITDGATIPRQRRSCCRSSDGHDEPNLVRLLSRAFRSSERCLTFQLRRRPMVRC